MKTLLCGVVLSVCLMAARAESLETMPLRTYNVFPAHVSSEAWEHVEAIRTQDNVEGALYQDFDETGSAYLRIERVHEGAPSGSTDAQLPDSTPNDESVPNDNGASDEIQTQSNDDPPPQTPNEESLPESTPTPEPEVDNTPQEEQPPSEPISLIDTSVALVEQFWSRTFSRTTQALPLATETVVEEVVQTEEVSAPSVTDEVEEVEEVVEEASVSPSDDVTVSSSTVTTKSNEDVEAATSCTGECRANHITLEDFSIPELDSGEHIEDAQIRLSLAAALRPGVSAERVRALTIEYAFSEEWFDAGSIVIDEEVSNALNGGYFLFALPVVDEPSALSSLRVRLSYEGDINDLEHLYIDSAWLELSLISLDEATLRERVSPEALSDLKKPEIHDLVSDQVDFALTELPHFTLRYHEQRNFIIRFFRSIFASRVADVGEVALIHKDYGDLGVEPKLHMTDDGLWTIQFDDAIREKLKPGEYDLTITVNEGSVAYTDTFSFQWGLLAINTHKSEYEVGETADISLGALSPNGNTICDAELLLYIIEPDGFIRRTPVSQSGLCNGNNVVDTPDYRASYVPTATGTYTLYVERIGSEGHVVAHTEDTFEVVYDAPLSIERHAPTRIYPVSPYVMELTVTAKDAFEGELTERVPHDYEITDTDARITQEGDSKVLHWDVALTEAGTHTVRYTFDSPDISPYLYLLGPATVDVYSGFEDYQPKMLPPSASTSTSGDAEAGTAPSGTADSLPTDADLAPQTTENALNSGVGAGTLPLSEMPTTGDAPVVDEVAPVLTPAPSETNEELSTTGDAPVVDEVVPAPTPAPSEANEALPMPEAAPLMQAVFDEVTTTTDSTIASSSPSLLSTPTPEVVSDTGINEVRTPVRSFTEKRRWQIASDATGSMLVYWTSGSSIPSGWTCLSCTATGTFFQRFARGGATYNSTGGLSSSTHSASGTVYTASLANGESQAGTEVADKSHTHTMTPSIASSTTLPPYRQLRVIQYNSAGEPASIPAGAVLMFDSSPPSGWSSYTAQVGYFPRGENTVGTTGGASTHTHAITGTTSTSTASTRDSRTGASQVTSADAGHTHTFSTTSASANHEPAYIEVVYATSTVATTTPVGALAMWTDTPPAGWQSQSSQAGDAFYDRFMKGASAYGTTGGSDSHTHTDLLSASSSVPSATDNARSGTDGSHGSHTHLVDVTNFTSSANVPPYVSVIVARNYGPTPLYTQSRFRIYANTDSQTPTDAWPEGATDLAENETLAATSTPVGYGDVIRFRMQVGVSNATSTGDAFKLQFSSTTAACASSTVWTDVGGSTSSVEWRGYNNSSPTDGATLSSTTLTGTDRLETYEEQNPSATMPNQIAVGEEGEWDFVVEQNGAYPAATYCFRMVESDGTAFTTYSVYPSVYTNDDPGTPIQSTPFDNEKVATTSPTFTFSAADAEGDNVTYQIQIDDDYAFGSVDVDRNSTSHLSQFDNLTTPADKDFNEGETIRFTLTSALTNNTTYYWRVRATDPDGSNTWGSWSDIWSVTTDTSLTASAWFQTMTEQFNSNTNVGVYGTTSNQMSLITGSTTGTSTIDAVNFEWGTDGNAWGSLTFNDTETSGDLKYRLQYYSGGTWANIPDSALSGNSSGFDTSPVSLLGLDTDTYGIIRVVAVFTNSGGSPTLQDWTLSWGYKIPAPETSMLFPNEKTGTTTPTFEFTTSDPQSDDLVYEIQWSTSSAFTASTTRISSSSSGFVNITNATDTSPFNSGNTIQFTIQASDALTSSTTYWWRVRAIDPSGSNSFSDYSDVLSFTVATATTVSTWFQTTREQFETNILSGATSTAANVATVATTAVESLIVYAEGTTQTPLYRTWSGSSWSDESAAQSVGSTINWIVTRAGTTREEYITGTLGTDGDINLQVYENGAWGNLQEVTTSISTTDMRAFDIVYEDTSGDALAVYCDGDADPSYYVWNGSSWTSGGTINVTSTDNCAWIKLIADPTSDEIIMIERDSTGTAYEAQVWNGSSWGNAVTFGSMGETAHEGIAAAYEESGNQAILVVSNGSGSGNRSFLWYSWNGSAWTGPTSQTTGVGGDFEWGTLVADVGSDNMALCYIDDGNDVNVFRWTGAAWTGQTELEASGLTKDDRSFDCAFEVSGARDGYIMVAYSDATNVRYNYWNGSAWATEASVDNIQDSATIQLRRTGANLLQLVAFDGTNDRYDYTYWNGTTWSTFETLETNASVGASPYKEPFMVGIRNPGTTGSVVGDPGIDFYDGSGPYWQQLSWSDTESGGSSILYQVEYYNSASSTWDLVPNSLVPGNSTGTTTSPIDLSNILPVATYSMLRPVANMTCSGGVCPTLADWTLTWAAGITISGTAKQYDQSTNVTSGTVAVALNGVLQVGKTGSISGGAWSIANVNAAPGDVITVFVTGAADSSEAVGVTVYDGVGNVSGIELFERHLSLGSDDLATTTNAHIGEYDFTDSEDLFQDVDGGSDLTVCATTGCGDAELYIKAGNRYQPGSGADISTHDFENNGTFLPNGNTIRISGSWDNNATATMATSSVIFTATSSSETVDDTGAPTAPTYYNVTFGEGSGTATWTLVTGLDIDGALSTTYGTLARGSLAITVAGNLTNGASGLWTGVGTTTFDGSSASTWTDSAGTKQNIGNVVVNGSSKTVTLGSSVRAQSITIGSDDILDASTSHYDITVLGHWTNNNTFTARQGEVIFAATTTNRVVAQGNSSFYDLTFNGVGGSWSFNGASLTVGNDFTVSTGTVTMPTGTTTVTGSWNTSGGLFAHSNGGVVFNSSAAETIALGGSAFSNPLYDVAFTGSGSWSFSDTNATTSNDMFVSGGTVTFPSGILALGGSLVRSGGSISANSGTLQLTSSASETLQTGGSSFASILVTGSGSWSFSDTNVTATGNVTIANGTLTLPSGTLTLGGSFTNTATFSHNSGTVLFNSTATGRTISPGNSSFAVLTFNSATGGWTIVGHATTTGATTLTAGTVVLATSTSLSVGGTFTNSIGGASTTWSGTLALVSPATFSANTKSTTGDTYSALIVGSSTKVSFWNSSYTSPTIQTGGYLYSQDHAAVDGDLYIYGAYTRTSGTEYWSYGTDFDGTALTASTSRQVDVRFASGASLSLSGATLSIVGTSSASTTVASISGTYTLSVSSGTTTASHYQFTNMDASGVQLLASTTVTALSDGQYTITTAGGTGLTIASSTIDHNAALQIYRVEFATTSAIAASNVTQSGGTPLSYWWFRESIGNIDGEFFDSDTGDPGSIRWDDSNNLISITGTVYSDDGLTPMGNPTCDDATPVVTAVVNGVTSASSSCASADGTFTISNVAYAGDPVITVYLNTNGGARATTVTRTPTGNITGLRLYQNRVMTRHENTSPLTIAQLAYYDEDNDPDIRFVASTGTTPSLTVRPDTELHIASSTTFAPGGDITLQSGGSGTSYDGSLHIDDGATFTGAGTSTYSVGGYFTLDQDATFTSASTTVAMTATTTGKSIDTIATQTITFHNLSFTGAGGGWSMDGDSIVNGTLSMATGTLSGTEDITLAHGSMTGNGTVALTSGTTTLAVTNTLGGTTPWTFYNLTLGSGSVVGTTTPPSATTTVGGVLTIANAHVLDAGASQWNLSGTGTPLVVSGTFDYDTSLIRYSGTGATNITSTSYYNLDVNASAGTPTFTGIGLGINVLGNLTVGGTAPTTFTLDTNDPALNVDGEVLIRANGTFVGSNSGSATIAGSWDNDGTFTHSGGTITFDSGSAATITAGNSSFGGVIVNKTGTVTLAEHATTSGVFTLTAASTFTVNPFVSLSVGGQFTNSTGGAATTWTNATLALRSGTNYQINASTTGDVYGTLIVDANTDIRMWGSQAATTTVDPSGSLYSMDHFGADGTLYIWGDYVKTSGTDYWGYTVDFDGTVLPSERNTEVYFAPNATATYSGGTLALLGTSTASTSVDTQGGGTYALRVTNTGTLNALYFEIYNINSDGVYFSGTPTVTNFARGAIEVSEDNASAVTVGGTVIDQNPAKTFTNMRFATTSGVSTAYNVTATGTSVSSWRFTNHTGSIDGEDFDVDPGGNPGYVLWDDSAAQITISGTVYSDEGSTPIGGPTCDDSTQTVHLRVAGLTSYTGSCTAASSTFSISGVVYSPGDAMILYLDTAGGAQAANVTIDPISSISNMHLYQNRVIVRHEDTTAITIDDMELWDSSDDTDIPFTAVSGSPDTLTLPANRKIVVWNNKSFAPGGNVTLSGGGGGASYDGTLELYSGAQFVAAGTESHSIGGSLISGSGASITGAQATFTFTTSGASRSVDTNDGTLYNVTFNGSGSFVMQDTNISIGNDLTITQGAVTLPVGTTTIAGSLLQTGGTFAHASGTTYFTSTGSETVRVISDLHRVHFNGSGGSWSFFNPHATATKEFILQTGSVSMPSGTFVDYGQFNVSGGTLTHNSGTLKLLGTTTATTLRGNGSTFGSITIAGTGSYTMEDGSPTLAGSLTVSSGSLTLATGTLSIGGSFTATGGTFSHASGTILFNSTDTGETINPGNSLFYNVSLAASTGGWTIDGSATTTGNFSLTSAAAFTQSSSTQLTVLGVFTNTVGGASTTWQGSVVSLQSGTNYTINTVTAGGDQYQTLIVGPNTDIRMWNSAATTTTVDPSGSLYSQDHANTDGALYIFGDYHRTSGSDYWSYATDFDGSALASSSRAVTVSFAANATTTVSGGASLSVVGALGATTTITNQGSGTYALIITDSTLSAQYYALRNANSDGLQLLGMSTISSLSNGDYELAVSGGSLVTVSSTTVNANTASTWSALRFATTSAITGYNIELVGSTTGYWTLTGETGNLSGEAFDSDGATDCGSLRWSDSTCLITEETHYRWRNDDGGEGVPSSEWYDTDWSKRKRVAIENADATGYVNAVVEIPVTYDSDMQSDFDDLRFTDSDGTTLISHWREVYTASTQATVWVEIPLLATSTVTNIYMYYGNGGVSDGSSGASTFAVFDDFEDGSISEYSGQTSLFTVSNTSAYERTYRLIASDVEGRTNTGGIYNTSASSTVRQGQTIRYMQYVSTTGGGDEPCTLFGVQAASQNYAVCLEVLGVDRVSLAENVTDRDVSGTVHATATLTYTSGWYEVEIDWTTGNLIAVTVSKDGSVVATTSATDSSYTQGGIGFTYWYQHGGWDMYTARPLLTTEPTVSISVEQSSGGASWYAARDTAASGIAAGETKRLRFVVQNGGLPITNQQFRLEYAAKDAPSCEAVSYSNYEEVPLAASCGTSPVCMSSSTQFSNQASTTDLLIGDGTFTYGKMTKDPSNKTDSLSVGSDEFTELEYALSVTSYATSSNYCLRVSNDGSSLDSYAKVAELGLRFDPQVTVWNLNNEEDIVIDPGTTTSIYATGTIMDLNGYADISVATATIYRSGLGPQCNADNNNCYRISSSSCTLSNCSGNTCDVSCVADIYFFADPTDGGTYLAQDWRADVFVADTSGGTDTQSTFGVELTTMRALAVDATIPYISLEADSDTGSSNATTSIQNIGNDAIDVELSGSNLSDGVSSVIPVGQQKYATSTFTYSSCVFCTTLTTTDTAYELDLSKPTTTTPVLSDDIYWGIAIPFGAAAATHTGTTSFMATGD